MNRGTELNPVPLLYHYLLLKAAKTAIKKTKPIASTENSSTTTRRAITTMSGANTQIQSKVATLVSFRISKIADATAATGTRPMENLVVVVVVN